MGNSLLDFVMALVRDPEAAARYAADPAGALSAAGLPGVTITDVQNLIPVVTDSLATTTPSFGGASDAANIWTSGAAAAALDAFHVPHPMPVSVGALPPLETRTIDTPPVEPVSYPPADQPLVESAPALDPLAADPRDHPPLDPAVGDWNDDGSGVGGWHRAHDFQPDHPSTDHPGFDLF